MNEISKKVTTKNTKLEYRITLTNSAEFGVVNQLDFFDHDISNGDNIRGYYVVENDDFVYNPRISTAAPVGPINRNQLGYAGVMSPLYYVFKVEGIDKDYLSYFFKTNGWHKFMFDNGNTGARFDRLSISDEVFGLMPIKHPKSLDEQRAIADFFKNLDTHITAEQEQLEKTKQMKSACLRSMFPQNGGGNLPLIRFKQYCGEWIMLRIGDIGYTYSGLSGKSKKDFDSGDAQFITFMNVLTNCHIDISTFQRVVVKDGEMQNPVLKGDLLFNTSSETPEEVGMCSVLDYDIADLYLNSFCFGYRLTDERVLSSYIVYLMRSPMGRQMMSLLAQGATRYNLPKREFYKAEIPIPPTIEEQERIASFFRSLDTKISLQTQRIEKLKQLKTACLSRMIA